MLPGFSKEPVGQSVKQNWDCSQIEHEEEEERGGLAEGKTQCTGEEDEELEEILGRRRKEGSSLQAEVMKKIQSQWYMNECLKVKK